MDGSSSFCISICYAIERKEREWSMAPVNGYSGIVSLWSGIRDEVTGQRVIYPIVMKMSG